MEKTDKTINTEQRILNFVGENYEVSAQNIIEFLGISPQATYKHLKKLIEDNKLQKMGRPPKVFYRLMPKKFNPILHHNQTIFHQIVRDITSEFLIINSEGKILQGKQAFEMWCYKRGFLASEKISEYYKLQKTYAKFKTEEKDFVIATNKFQETFKEDTQVDEVYYCDFYSIVIFGKTKLGALLLHGKQVQNLKIIHQVCLEVKNRITNFIKENKIDAVAFIPPTVPRKPQFMDEFKKILNLNIPIIKLEKITNDIAIQQKTQKSSQDRIENARNTIFVDDKRSFKNILLLDDAVGSGSTFNEIARKIRKKKTLQESGKIYAISIVGSANGIVDNSKKFEVISEV